jgi:hypothetical protein
VAAHDHTEPFDVFRTYRSVMKSLDKLPIIETEYIVNKQPFSRVGVVWVDGSLSLVHTHTHTLKIDKCTGEQKCIHTELLHLTFDFFKRTEIS